MSNFVSYLDVHSSKIICPNQKFAFNKKSKNNCACFFNLETDCNQVWTLNKAEYLERCLLKKKKDVLIGFFASTAK